MGKLSTHVLDITQGKPGVGVKVELYALDGNRKTLLKTEVTNHDGRTDAPILPAGQFTTGVYELVFHAGAYLDATGAAPEAPRFLDMIPIRFGISQKDSHYHVPLLLSPFGYATYRGS